MIGWKPKSNDSAVASVRYRCLIPLSALQARGFPVALYTAEDLDRYSAVIFSKLYDEPNRALASKLKERGTKVVLDLCDNHFYNSEGNAAYVKAGADLHEMLALADFVVCSTEALADAVMAEAKLSRRPDVVGDPVDPHGPSAASPPRREPVWKRWFRGTAAAATGLPRLVWFGIHGSPNAPGGMLDILNVAPVLERAARERPFELLVVSNSKEKFDRHIAGLGFPTSYREWEAQRFSEVLAPAMGVIIPVSRNPFTLCKSNNRLATALFAGVPVIADSIPSYAEFAPYAFLDDWESGLRAVLSGTEDARSRARAGRAYVESHWMPGNIADRWQAVLASRLEIGWLGTTSAGGDSAGPPPGGFRAIELSERDVAEVNAMLDWNAGTLLNGRLIGRLGVRPGKRDTPGEVPDRRIVALHERLDLTDKSVLEAGCFEGIHTLGLRMFSRDVTAIDVRPVNVVKTLARLSLHGADAKVFVFDVERLDLTFGAFDLLFHCGVLYHLREPVQHLLRLRGVCRHLFLDTHVAPENASDAVEVEGRRYRGARHPEGGWKDPFSGKDADAFWLAYTDLLAVLGDAGFGAVELLERREERNGPRVALLASVQGARAAVTS